MDIDAFEAVHRPDWDRLAALSGRRRLSGPEADELIRLYQRVSTHLSLLRSVAPESPTSALLSARLARARTRFTGARSNLAEDVARFFVIALPAALYRLRWLTVVVGVVFCAVAAAYALWVASDPQVLATLGTEASRRRLVEREFVDYYSENPAASFAGSVWVNNAWIAAQCVAFGVTGLWVPAVLLQNAQSLGLTAGIMVAYGRTDTFFLFILPHGLMELTSVFVAGAAGLAIFWAWVRPGPRTRLQALAEEGRSLVTVALGLVLVLAVSGLVEGFVTPSGLPAWLRIGIGALVLAAFWTYVLVLGRRAVAAGQRGDLDPADAGYRELAA
ncbi:membrane protein [Tersicoccus solisilvae]|uniref:Membrane protein n=1 Tax=Tersicoccus solisilvae TaxID=1882339 RepID=A0ABQ1P7V4_9MICC|nr:stage II sporulation protein M [Tersicoccus solisilvae]GGC92789.1 membrane protein [Tersicoccus solisilvae]